MTVSDAMSRATAARLRREERNAWARKIVAEHDDPTKITVAELNALVDQRLADEAATQ